MRRQRRTRAPRPDIPAWADRLIAGEIPARDSADWDSFIGWVFFADCVPGLPTYPDAGYWGIMRAHWGTL